MEASNYETTDGWIRDGHTLSPVLIDEYVKLEVYCPDVPDAVCGGREHCYVHETIDDVQAEAIEGVGNEGIRDFPLKVDYRWLHDDELWLRPSK